MNDVDFPVERVLEGIDAAAAAGLPIKVNMVVKRGVNEDSVLPMARLFREHGHILRFIEYMDVGHTNGWRLDDVVPAAEIVATDRRRAAARAGRPNYRGEVASAGATATAAGEIGVIASVTQPFCGDCTRARLSADGGCTRASSPCAATTSAAVRPSVARRTRRSHDDDRPDLGPARRPLLGDPHRENGRPAQGRDVLHRRMNAACRDVNIPSPSGSSHL